MTKNATNDILMIRPARFGMNAQTAIDNFYQQQDAGTTAEADNAKAQMEFDRFVEKLRGVGVQVHVVQDTPEPHTPDSIFPNNWISMHSDGRIALYPMKAENRRLERIEGIEQRLTDAGFRVDATLDYSSAELEGIYLEGTGSIIFDHDAQIAYMARSQRADEFLLEELCKEIDYTPVVFSAFQDTPEGRQPIYHTNVLMCMTDRYAVICLDTIDDAKERAMVVDSLERTGKSIVEITEAQKHQFAGNMLLVKGAAQALYLVMSSSAYEALEPEQVAMIEAHHTILHSDLETIETLGGGSARCMLAEIYLPKQAH